MQVLLVDDDLEDVLLARRAWRKIGFPQELRVAKDGQELINYLTRTDIYKGIRTLPLPGLIFLDVKMPQKDGFETLSELKSNPIFKHIPVVMLTGSHDEKDVKRAYDLGASGFITKPGSFKLLKKVMEITALYWIDIVTLPGGQPKTCE